MFKFTFANDFFSSKTTWTAVTAIGSAVTAGLHHQITWPQATVAIFGALFAAFHRDTAQKGIERASTDRGELLDHIAVSTGELIDHVAGNTEASVIPGFPLTLGNLLPFFESWAAQHSKAVTNLLPLLLLHQHQPPAVPTVPVPEAAPAVPEAAPAASSSVVEPVNGEADAKG